MDKYCYTGLQSLQSLLKLSDSELNKFVFLTDTLKPLSFHYLSLIHIAWMPSCIASNNFTLTHSFYHLHDHLQAKVGAVRMVRGSNFL